MLLKKNIFGFWTVCHMKTRHSKIFSPSSAVYGWNNKSTDRENDCYLQPFSLTWIKNVATFNPKSYHFLNKSHTRSNQDGVMTSRTRRTCKVQICDNTTRRKVRTYGGEQVHGAVQDHQFGTRLHTVHRTVQEWRSVLHLHVAGHMVHLLTDLKEETLSWETWSRQIYYCYTNYCVTFPETFGSLPSVQFANVRCAWNPQKHVCGPYFVKTTVVKI